MKKKLASKLLIVGVLSFLPVSGLLYTLTEEMSISINFANKEIQGLGYIKIVKGLLEEMPDHKLLLQKFLLGNENLKENITKTQKKIDEAFIELNEFNNKNTLDADLSNKINALKNDWNKVKSKAFSMTSEKSDVSHKAILKNLKKLIVSIGDSSNLIRDPDVASFYLTDSVLVKLTSKINTSDSVIEVADKILSDNSLNSSQKSDAADLKNLLGDDEVKTKKSGSIDLDDKANLTLLIGLLDSISDDLKDGYSKAFLANSEIKDTLGKILNGEQKTTESFIKLLNSSLIKSSSQVDADQLEKLGKEVLKANFDLWSNTVTSVETLVQTRVDKLNQRKYLILLASLAFSLMAILIGFYMVKNIVDAIRKLEDGAKRVSNGNFDIKVTIDSEDELGSLSSSFNNMVQSIRMSNQKLTEGSVSMEILQEKIDTLNRMTDEIKKAKEESERNSFNLESLIKETSSSIYEIKQTSDLVADNARIVSEAAELSVQISTDGQKAVKDSIKSVDKIKQQIEAIAEKILELSKQTQTIGEIISTVDDISKQSRLLAFNAAIEASKANEYGKGFSVVAGEIKGMAEESREATKRISNILGQIQHFTNTIVMLTEDGMKLADIGSDLSKVAGDSIDKLIDSINNSSEVAAQISVSSLEQKTGMEQLEESMRNIAFSRK